ncbi:aromatic ring-opening dioxygenase LigA [Nocardioides sp. NPDC051685]|uniref:aromatic ring-opening dioxygenase LigA n=1 Tax=Nocardioides sp. NPDC051685 TaxID=3364334 RepID=UPI00379C3D18
MTRKPRIAKLLSPLIGLFGLLFIASGASSYYLAHAQLKAQEITVADDASFLAGDKVDGPFSAYSQAATVEKHALGITKGKTYAELDQKDPIRAVAAESSFVRASLLTAVTAFGLSALVAGLGVVLLFVAFALGSLTRAVAPAKVKATDETDGLEPAAA